MQLSHRNLQVRDLQRELALFKRQCAELQIAIDLNTFKYSSYVEYKQQSDRESLEKLSDSMAIDDEFNGSSDDLEGKMDSVTKKLMYELEALETKHKSSALDAADKISRLDQECRMHESTIVSLRDLTLLSQKQFIY